MNADSEMLAMHMCVALGLLGGDIVTARIHASVNTLVLRPGTFGDIVAGNPSLVKSHGRRRNDWGGQL